MNENLKDILSHLNPNIDQETLLLYLQGKLSAEAQHEVEKKIVEDDFESEALEGLESIKDKKQLLLYVDQLNRELKKKTEKKRQWRKKMELKIDAWVIILVVVVLFLAVIGFILIHQSLNR